MEHGQIVARNMVDVTGGVGLNELSQEGMEHTVKIAKQLWERATSHGGGKAKDPASKDTKRQTMLHVYRAFLVDFALKQYPGRRTEEKTLQDFVRSRLVVEDSGQH